MSNAKLMKARVSIAGSLRGEDWWAVAVTTERGRTIWDDYETRQQAERGADAARAYYRHTERGVEEPAGRAALQAETSNG